MTEPEPEPEDQDERDALAKALANITRDPDGTADHEVLVDEVARQIDFDEWAERRRKARNIIKRARGSGTTPPDGQLHFAAIDPYDYEPDRLVLGDSGRIVENARAKPAIKLADARRKMRKAAESLAQANRAQVEAEGYSTWATEQVRSDRAWEEITFDSYVREAGVRQ